jgi:hypothetical protein
MLRPLRFGLLFLVGVGSLARAEPDKVPAAPPEEPPANPVFQTRPPSSVNPVFLPPGSATAPGIAVPAQHPAPPPAAPGVAPGPSAAVAAKGPETKKDVPWRGSLVYYGHSVSALTLNRAAEPWYNPSYDHRLDLWGEWHFNKTWFTRLFFSLGQELTVSDDYNNAHEVVASDLLLEAGATELPLPLGLKATTTARLTLPASKTSAAQTRLFALGPSAGLSRKFEVAAGLTLTYGARFDFRFNRFTTAQNHGPRLEICSNVNTEACLNNADTGTRNAWGVLAHGPRLFFNPTEKLTLVSYFQFFNQFLYRLAPGETPLPREVNLAAEADPGVRFGNTFGLIASYAITKPLSVSVGVITGGPGGVPQLGTDSRLRNPFFNRYTTFSLDAVIDVEAVIASF